MNKDETNDEKGQIDQSAPETGGGVIATDGTKDKEDQAITPQEVISIKKQAFISCKSLPSITIHDSVIATATGEDLTNDEMGQISQATASTNGFFSSPVGAATTYGTCDDHVSDKKDAGPSSLKA
tara:strand:+ start:276 stop:650 length:375 start_codon:yes stop_codon:yes gene_type:complete